ncbi:MAG: cytochrome c [Acidimicrobiales bacterium]|nr:cytochrome c [Acidimicrobiales bacterium]
MRADTDVRPPSTSRFVAAGLVVVSLLVGVVACSSDKGGDENFPEAKTDQAARGRELILQGGCAACHNTDGSKTSGPTWKGLAGSTVTLSDGRKVVADTAYLTKAIVDPKAEGPLGYPKVMPSFAHLSPGDVAAIVAYIEGLPKD